MGNKQINQFGRVSSPGLSLDFLVDPGNGDYKKMSLAQLQALIGGGGGGDTTPPSLSSITVENGAPADIILTYNEALDSGSVPATGDFAVSGGKTVTGVDVSGTIVTVTVNSAYSNTDTITISYTPGTNKIQDLATNHAASLSSHSVTNNVTSGFDTDAQAYFTAVAGAGVTLSTPYKNAVNTFILALKSGSIWSKLHALYLFRLGSANGHKFNLKDAANLDASFRLTFNGTINQAATGGILSDGSTGYADTHYVPSTTGTLNNTSHGVYINGTAGNASEIGGDVPGYHHIEYSLGVLYGIMGSFTTGDYANFTTADPSGFIVSSRISSTSIKLYQNGSQVGSTATAANGSALSGANTYLLCKNSSGATGFSPRIQSMAFIGAGLSDTDVANFNTALTTLFTAI